MSYLLAFLGIAVLIVLHELGHLFAAKAVGMRVERFSLFFGPMIVRRTIGETEYGIGVIPLGGFAKITGMSPEEELPADVRPRAYCNQPVWKRVVVVAAGPAVNLLVAFVILWFIVIGMSQGVVDQHGQPWITNTVGTVIRPSAAAGVLEPGDRILSIDGTTGNWQTLRNVIGADRCTGAQVNGCKAARPLRIAVSRHGRRILLTVTPTYSAANHRVEVGFGFAQRTVPIGPLTAARLSAQDIWKVTSGTISTIARIFQSKDRRQLHSVVAIVSYEQQSISQGTSSAFEFLALISLALGIINLFPFLPLDGGHIFWALVEKLRGRRVPLVVMERACWVGVALVLSLFAIGLSNDISAISHNDLVLPR